MSYTFTMEMKMTHDGVDEAIRKMGQAKDQAIMKLAYRIFELSQEHLADGGTDTGVLLESGYVEQIGPGHWRIGYTAPWAAPREFGSRAHMPPVDALIPWCRRHMHSSPNKVLTIGGPRQAGKGPRIGFKAPGKAERQVGKMMGSMVSAMPFASKLKEVHKAVNEIKRARSAAKTLYKASKKAYKGFKKARRLERKNDEARSFAWAVAMSIKKRGTEPSPYLRPAFQEGQSEFVKHFKEAVNENAPGGNS